MPIKFSAKNKKEFRSLGVITVYLFGSRAQSVAGPLSDYDYAVLLAQPSILKNYRAKAHLYDAIYDILSPLSPRTLDNDVIDIVFLQSGVSLELQANVVKHSIVLFDDDPDSRADYEAQVMIRFADVKPILHQIDQAILARI